MEQEKLIRFVYLFVGIGALALALLRIQSGNYSGTPFAFLISGFCAYRLLTSEENSETSP